MGQTILKMTVVGTIYRNLAHLVLKRMILNTCTHTYNHTPHCLEIFSFNLLIQNQAYRGEVTHPVIT